MKKKSMLPSLGKELQDLRKKNYPKDTQKTFAFRVCVSRATYQKMEKGDLTVSMKSYYSVLKLLDMEDRIVDLFKANEEPMNLIGELNL